MSEEQIKQELKELQEKYNTLAVENMLEVNKLCNEIDRLRNIAEAAIDWLKQGNRDDVRTAELIQTELDKLKEGAK